MVGVAVPGNAAANEIVRLRSVNADIDTQIGELRSRQIANAETAGALSNVAVWVAPAEPVAPELEVEAGPIPAPLWSIGDPGEVV